MDSYIPIVDFSKTDEIELARELNKAFTEVGFVCLVNHGADMEQIQRAHQAATEFFDLPLEVKRKYRFSLLKNHPQFGYIGPNDEKVNRGEAPVDIKEGFDFCKFIEPPMKYPTEEDAGDFTSIAKKLMKDLVPLAQHVVYLIGLGLGEEYAHKFTSLYPTGKDLQLRFLNYPQIPSYSEMKPGQLRLSPHSDYGGITLLFQDECGGLQVLNKQGEFVDATPIKGGVYVNIGDFLALCSGGRLKSNIHRVVITEENFKKRRISMPFFYPPDGDMVCQPLPDEAGNIPPPISFNQLRNDRFAENKSFEY